MRWIVDGPGQAFLPETDRDGTTRHTQGSQGPKHDDRDADGRFRRL
jgi:hypothetical protein